MGSNCVKKGEVRLQGRGARPPLGIGGSIGSWHRLKRTAGKAGRVLVRESAHDVNFRIQQNFSCLFGRAVKLLSGRVVFFVRHPVALDAPWTTKRSPTRVS